MKHIQSMLKALQKSVLLLPLVAFFPIQSQAATLEDVVKEVKEMRENIVDWLSSAKDLYLEYLFEANPSYPATLAANTSRPSIDDKVNELAEADIKSALIQDKTDYNKRLLSSLQASDSSAQTEKKSSSLFANSKDEEQQKKSGDENLNVGSLLTPLTYDSDQAKNAASRFIQFSTGINEPLSVINISNLNADQKKKLDDTPAGRDYRVYLRSLVAARSIAMDNILRMYAERLPVENLGKEAGIPDKDKVDASPLQVQEYKATRRVTTPSWYQAMSKAAPATVERETLFVLAEIREQLYRMQQDNQRVILLLSIMELQNMQTNKVLDKNKEDEIRRLLGV